MPLDSRAFGKAAERFVRARLGQLGWRTRAARLWAGDAEFDLLLTRAGEVSICEVKARRVRPHQDPRRVHPGERVDEDRRARLLHAAGRLARDIRRPVHVDVAEVTTGADGRGARVVFQRLATVLADRAAPAPAGTNGWAHMACGWTQKGGRPPDAAGGLPW